MYTTHNMHSFIKYLILNEKQNTSFFLMVLRFASWQHQLQQLVDVHHYQLKLVTRQHYQIEVVASQHDQFDCVAGHLQLHLVAGNFFI